MGKLGKRFRRELAASPKKAAVLGLLALVALYYWAPLVWGWVAKRSETTEAGVMAPAPAAPAVPSAAAPAPASNAAPTKTAYSPLPWQQVIKLIENDERTLAAELRQLRRDPFALPKATAAQLKADAEAAGAAKLDAEAEARAVAAAKLKAEAEARAAEAAKLKAEADARAAEAAAGKGLSLNSTILGSDRRVARISGRSYEEGQTIQVRKDGRTVTFTLAEVHARRVVLTGEKNTYELTIPDPLQSKKIELSRSGN